MFLPGNFDGFSADSNEVMDGLTDGSTDESIDVWTEGSFPRYGIYGNFHTGIFIGNFTLNLADGRTDGADNQHTC